jgi:iron complex transport system substrate-binding protein
MKWMKFHEKTFTKAFLLILVSIVLVIGFTPYSRSYAATLNQKSPGASKSATRVIADMYGRTLTVPKIIKRVLTSDPFAMQLVYLLAPDKLAGLSFPFGGNSSFVPDKYKNLPVMGGWFGTQTGSYETFIAAKPDIVVECIVKGIGRQTNIKERQYKLGDIPVVVLYANDSLTGYEQAIRFLGELLGVQSRAESLIGYYKDARKYVTEIVSTIPEKDKIKVYYAEGKDGFSTDPAGSAHTRLLEFCGGSNVAHVSVKPGGMANTSLEQLFLWDPDMIIIGRGSQASLFNAVMADPRWGQLRAVQNKKVAIRPDNPFSWFDGPSGPCQMVGMYWMVNKLYPGKTARLDLKTKVKEFYSKFFHYNLTDDHLVQLLADPK